MAFGGISFPQSKPQMHQAGVIQQQAPQESGGGGGGLLGSLFGMGLNMLMPGLGSGLVGLATGNPQQALGGVAQMAGLDTGGGVPGSGGQQAPGQQPPTPSQSSPTTNSSENKDDETSATHEMGHPQKIEDPQQKQNGQPQQDPSSELQRLLAMLYMSQMFQGMNPSMFPMPHNPVTGMNPAARSPISGGIVGV